MNTPLESVGLALPRSCRPLGHRRIRLRGPRHRRLGAHPPSPRSRRASHGSVHSRRREEVVHLTHGRRRIARHHGLVATGRIVAPLRPHRSWPRRTRSGARPRTGQLSGDRARYARALLQLAEVQACGPPSLAARQGEIETRIRWILKMNQKATSTALRSLPLTLAPAQPAYQFWLNTQVQMGHRVPRTRRLPAPQRTSRMRPLHRAVLETPWRKRPSRARAPHLRPAARQGEKLHDSLRHQRALAILALWPPKASRVTSSGIPGFISCSPPSCSST